MNAENTSIAIELTSLAQKQFTGMLEIQNSKGQQWQLYLRLGRLVWADGGYHPQRSWQRHLNKYCPQLDFKKISKLNIKNIDNFECYNYLIIAVLLQKKLVSQDQVKPLIESKVEEVVFESIVEQNKEQLIYTIKSVEGYSTLESTLKTPFTLLNVEKTLELAAKKWAIWIEKGLGFWSPNLAPRIKMPEHLRREVSDIVYENFVKLLDGNNTLLDIAIEMKSNVIKVTCSLVPYISKGLLDLVEVADIKAPIKFKSTESPQIARARKPLVVCIDDSRQICKIMEEIINKAKCRFISVNHPLQAMPTLIASNPDLIFLDLGMPIINGYEMCSQIRRVSQLKEIPVIILTGRDGIVDRMRAKVVGASDFLSKPIEEEKILKTLEKFLLEKSNCENTLNSNLNLA